MQDAACPLKEQFQTLHIILLAMYFNHIGRVSSGFQHICQVVPVAFREEYLQAPTESRWHFHAEELFEFNSARDRFLGTVNLHRAV